MPNKNTRLIFFIIYFSIFFVLPIFIAIPHFNPDHDLKILLYAFFLVFTISYLRNEWKMFPKEKYLLTFIPFILNLLIITFSHNWKSISNNILISWAITFTSIMCAEILQSLYKEFTIVNIKKENWENTETPFLKKYWRQKFFKQTTYLGGPLFLLFSSSIISFSIFLVIIYPDYINTYQYPQNLTAGIYVLISFILGTINYLRVFKNQPTD